MGNCLSKYPVTVDIGCSFGGLSSLQTGVAAEHRAYAIGAHAKHETRILTPVGDRFPLQACDLEIDSFHRMKIRGGGFKVIKKVM